MFRGDSSDCKDLLFSVKKSSLVQFRTELDVFLDGSNTNNQGYDFKVIGSWLEKTCTIYTGHSSTIIAQVIISSKPHKAQDLHFLFYFFALIKEMKIPFQYAINCRCIRNKVVLGIWWLEKTHLG